MHANRDNYFDVAQALYWICVDWHGGQSSVLYRVQCQLDYTPSCMECGTKGHGDECADEIYEYLNVLGTSDYGKLESECERLLAEVETAYQETR